MALRTVFKLCQIFPMTTSSRPLYILPCQLLTKWVHIRLLSGPTVFVHDADGVLTIWGTIGINQNARESPDRLYIASICFDRKALINHQEIDTAYQAEQPAIYSYVVVTMNINDDAFYILETTLYQLGYGHQHPFHSFPLVIDLEILVYKFI
jgi:hypothetical protein